MTRTTRIRLGAWTFFVAACLGTVLWPVDAEAGRSYAVPQAPCEQVGATAKARNGETYRCEQRKDDLCPKWHWVYRPDKPKGSWTPRPGSPCPKCSPSPSATASNSPSAAVTTTHSSSPKPSTSNTPAAPATATPQGEDFNNHPGMLPVTGTAENVAALAAIIGALLILLGGAAIAITKPWRRYDT